MKRLIHSDAFFNEFRAVNISTKSPLRLSLRIDFEPLPCAVFGPRHQKVLNDSALL
jgi:hypothetical protein